MPGRDTLDPLRQNGAEQDGFERGFRHVERAGVRSNNRGVPLRADDRRLCQRIARSDHERGRDYYCKDAMHSISTRAPFGSAATCTVLRAGREVPSPTS